MKSKSIHRRGASTGSKPPCVFPLHQAASRLATQWIDPYIRERVRFRARRLADAFHLPADRREDVEQDLALELLKACRRFDRGGSACWRTYASRVLDLAVKKLSQRECRRRRREAGRPKRMADAPAGAAEAIQETHDDLLALERRLDVAHVLSVMPPRLRALCALLKRLTPPETAKVMGLHRSSIYRPMARIRAYFETAGLGFSQNSAADSRSVRR